MKRPVVAATVALLIIGICVGFAGCVHRPERMTVHAAAEAGNTRALSLLLDRGADVNARDEHQATPLHRAAGNGHVKTAALLLDRGADLNARDERGRTPLHEPAWWGGKPRPVAAMVVARGVGADALEEHDNTLSHNAACWIGNAQASDLLVNRHTLTAALLLDRGADVNAPDDCGATPLHIAAKYGQPQMAALLLDRGADLNACDDLGMTPLQWGAEYGYVDTTSVLRARSAQE